MPNIASFEPASAAAGQPADPQLHAGAGPPEHRVRVSDVGAQPRLFAAAAGRWSEGPSLDGKGEFSSRPLEPLGGEPELAPPRPDSGAQTGQMLEGVTPPGSIKPREAMGGAGGGLMNAVKHALGENGESRGDGSLNLGS